MSTSRYVIDITILLSYAVLALAYATSVALNADLIVHVILALAGLATAVVTHAIRTGIDDAPQQSE